MRVETWNPKKAADCADLSRCLAIRVARVCSAARAAEMRDAVLSAREHWIHDFEGAQFALGRAFYTHLETGAAKAYFDGARASDALVERILPGMQDDALRVLGQLVGSGVRKRPGFCGPGVPYFPGAGAVARRGGVIHYDLEGLTDEQIASNARAVTLVWMLAPSPRGGGLRLFDASFDGRPDTEIDTQELASRVVRSGPGDALLLESRRLHQIMPFEGKSPRVSVTVHAVEVDTNAWEAWF